MVKRMTPSSACAACKIHRKKCPENCVLAPHFRSDDPNKFAVVQRVFGTSHIVKMLQGVDHNQRRDAVNSMVNEATARLKDPIHGSAGEIHQLQQKIAELESQLEATQAELMNIRSQYDKLVYAVFPSDATSQPMEDIIYEDADPLLLWGPQWDI